MEELSAEDADKPATDKVSPKVTRPKLPKFSSHTLGHHFRHKTDPGQTSEIKNLMEEIKKWKDGSIFDKSPIRTKVVKPQVIPKAHSTHTSPRGSPPPGSPSSGNRSSSLNRSRSRSLKLLTDKLKSPRGGGSRDGSTSPNILAPKTATGVPDGYFSAKPVEGAPNNTTDGRNQIKGTGDSRNDNRKIPVVSMETDGENKTIIVEPIPENEEEEEERNDREGETGASNHERGVQRFENFVRNKLLPRPEDDQAAYSDSEAQSSQVSTFTLHPIDRNSEFLRLRQTAPPKRRPAYAGLPLPKPKITPLYKLPDEGKDVTDNVAKGEEIVIRKPNMLDLSGLSSVRKLSPTKLAIKSKEELGSGGSLDISGQSIFRTPSTESPPTLPGPDTNNRIDYDASSPMSDTRSLTSDKPEELGATCADIDEPVISESDTDTEKVEKRNGKSPKQKSKSDPSGNKTFDFNVAGVINSSQSNSYPLLKKDKMNDSVTEIVEGQNEAIEVKDEPNNDNPSTELDILNNNDPESEPGREVLTSLSETDKSISEDQDILSPQNEMTMEPFEEPMSRSFGEDGHRRMESGGMSPVQEDGDEGLTLAGSTYSYGSESSTSTPLSYSPTGTMDRQPNLLNVPSPKRPILRSVSSASVLQRERKFSGGNKEKEGLGQRKHSLTTTEDNVPMEAKAGEFLNLGDVTGSALASSMPSVWNTERHASVSPERDTAYVKDKRYHIVEELYRNEREYVDALKMLKERYMDPLKTVSGIDERVVDNIFYMIPEILTHHQIYLEFLNQVWTRWNTDTSTVGDLIQKTFSGQTVQDSYLSFVENYKTSGKVIENALQTKSSVQKFVEQCQKESGSKLSLKDLIVRPIQRIPRYELLIQRLLDNTPGGHPDYTLLQEADKVMHEFARKIGTLKDTSAEDGTQDTLKKLEILLMTDLAAPERYYIRHDMVNMATKKDQCCIWLLSDMIIMSSVKRKSGPVTRKASIILKSPTGQDFVENVKHKVWLKVGLDDIEIVRNQDKLKKQPSLDKEQVEEDMDLLMMIQDLTNKLNCNHAGMDDIIKEMNLYLNKQLTEHNLRTSLLDTNKMELKVYTQEDYPLQEVNFLSGDKRSSWESTFLDAKQKLSLLSDKRSAEFSQSLQITKTRAGMQFSCAAPIDGVNSAGYRDVWVCNSDGYVGHMCLLSLQPEPIVTLNTPVPGCNARILCIAAVPAHGCLRRKSSAKRYQKGCHSPPATDGPRISIEEVDSAITEEGEPAKYDDSEQADEVSEEGYQSDSSSSEDDDDDFISTRKLFVEEDDVEKRESAPQNAATDVPTTGSWSQDPLKSTMWLGTEDGCIHIFQCTDNIKTTKNKLKIQLGYPIYCILYLDNKVFVSLSNGDLIVYRRDTGNSVDEGTWDTENPYTRAIGSVTGPIVKMLAVAGKLWCGRQNNICVINPLTLTIEKTFQVHQESNRCVQCIVNSGQGVWIASQQSYKVLLYHATTFEFLMEINIKQAVGQKLQSADDIIRQHKTACLRITALLVCKDMLWIGTSAGVVLTIAIPKITSTTSRGSLTTPTVTGLQNGHTGHVRFLTCVEMSHANMPSSPTAPNSRSDSTNNNNKKDDSDGHASHNRNKRRPSVATMTAALATRMLVISGGDGYEDFQANAANESAGKDDSTNHLLLWQV